MRRTERLSVARIWKIVPKMAAHSRFGHWFLKLQKPSNYSVFRWGSASSEILPIAFIPGSLTP